MDRLDTRPPSEQDEVTVGRSRPVCDFDTRPATARVQLGHLIFQVCGRHLGAARLQERILAPTDSDSL